MTSTANLKLKEQLSFDVDYPDTSKLAKCLVYLQTAQEFLVHHHFQSSMHSRVYDPPTNPKKPGWVFLKKPTQKNPIKPRLEWVLLNLFKNFTLLKILCHFLVNF